MNGPQVLNLPASWALSRLGDVAAINPKLVKTDFVDSLEVSFVPMPAVQAGTGEIDVTLTRQFGEVKAGYTAFREGDVLFAKITPCMENGKMAVVPKVCNGLAFGSTEFHVLRPHSGISARYIYHFVSSRRFRYDAEHNMTGAVGQRRVPTIYLSDHLIPIAPSDEQTRIVAKIEELFSELDSGVENLRTAREQLQIYRQAVLKHAFEGKLTADWRTQHQPAVETRQKFFSAVQRIRQETYARAAATHEKNDHSTRKVKPLTPISLSHPLPADVSLPSLPSGWHWAPLEWLLSVTSKPMTTGPFGTALKKNEHQSSGVPVLGIENIGKASFVPGNKIFVTEEKAVELSPFEVRAGDVLISRSGTVGEICTVPPSLGTALISTNLMRVSLNAEIIAPAFFVYMFQGAGSVKAQVKALCKGSSREFLNQSILGSIAFPLCSLDEQSQVINEIEERLSKVDAMESEIEQELDRVQALRLAILMRAFSGRLVAQDPNDEPVSALLERISTKMEDNGDGRKKNVKNNGKKKAT